MTDEQENIWTMPSLSELTPGERWLEGGQALLEKSGRVVEVNESLAQWLGDTPADCRGKTWLELLAQRYPEWTEILKDSWPGEEVFQHRDLTTTTGPGKAWYRLETIRSPDGFFVVLSSLLPPPGELAESGWQVQWSGEQAQRSLFVRLLRTESQLESLVRRWPGVIFNQRADFSFQFVSPQIEELTGIPEAQWQRSPQVFWQVVHESDAEELRQQFRRVVQAPQGLTSTYRIRHQQTGRVTYLMEHRRALASERGLVLGYEGVWLDVTRQTIAEKRLSSAAWKETLAVLTMGLAHDFSNIMAGIHSLSESYLTQVDSQHPFREGLALIKQHSLQASQLVHRIINLHHGKTGERNYHNLNEIIPDLVELVGKILPRRVQVTTLLTSESLPLYVDAVELRQVILNLTLNAADAMPRGGKLVFRTCLQASWPPPAHYEGAPPRLPAVCLAVEDSGCGIHARHLHSIFDPFFTTKAMNKGSGLGLYNARVFVEKHQGAISVESEEGRGTTICLWLPQADFTEAERAVAVPNSRRHTLLLVGPAGRLMESSTEFLRLNGFHVVVADNRDKALESLTSSDYQFSGVFLLAAAKDHDYAWLLDEANRCRWRLKTFLQTVGCNQDELNPRLLQHADAILTPDLSTQDILRRLHSVLGDTPPTTL